MTAPNAETEANPLSGMEFDVLVEIPKGQKNKYEVDHATGRIRLDRTLFTSAEGIERLWELSQPLLDNPPPVRPYAQGSWGPNRIHQLITPHLWRLPFERTWRDAKEAGS